MKKILKSKINRRILTSISKIGVVFAALFFFAGITGTFAYFSDTATIQANASAGVWIPTLTMSVNPSSPDGGNGWYKTSPCITLNASGVTVGSSKIYYEFSDDGDPIDGGTIYTGGCINVPDGNPTHFQAQAVNTLNPSWKSNIVNEDFKVDTQCPSVKVTNPSDSSTLNGAVEIRGTVTDANPHHYWLAIENSSGTQVVGPGTVNDTTSFTDKKFFNWDTTRVPDGTYTIKLEARDAFGNKCPNQAPVPVDPEDPNDSVDWITVTVDNNIANHVVINEVYYDTNMTGGPEYDEFIELYNPTSEIVNLSSYKLGDEETKWGGEGMYQFPAGTTIASHDFLVVAYKAINFNTAFGFKPDFEFVDSDPSVPDMIKYTNWANGLTELSNSGDEVLLLNGSDVPVDVVTYEGGSYPGIVAHSGVSGGYSIARSPKGYDTDNCADDFVPLSSPNPGTNPHTVPRGLSSTLKKTNNLSAINSGANENENNAGDPSKEESQGEINNTENSENENSQEDQVPPEEVIDNSQKDEEVLEEEKEEPALPPENKTEEENENSEEPID